MIERLIPNVIRYHESLIKATGDTLIMVAVSSVIALILGSIVGILIVITQKGHILENPGLNNIICRIVDLVRSMPFVILITLFLPITRLIVGTSIGVKGATVPMILAIIPFVARQIEQAITEVNPGVIEAAESMGLSKRVIIFRIMLKEARAGVIRAVIISIISLLNLSAMAGTVGGGGLGDFAIRYGYGQYMTDITIVTVLILLVLVTIVQGGGALLIKKITH